MRGNTDDFYANFISLNTVDHPVLLIESRGAVSRPLTTQSFVVESTDQPKPLSFGYSDDGKWTNARRNRRGIGST